MLLTTDIPESKDALITKTKILETLVEEGPKDMTGKPEFAVIPWDALEYIVRVFEYGASNKKYKKPFSYRAGIKNSKLISAAIQHMVEWFYYGESFDEESKCHHLAHAAANCMMLLTMLEKNEFDDRP